MCQLHHEFDMPGPYDDHRIGAPAANELYDGPRE
jgi:hypothetical protein